MRQNNNLLRSIIEKNADATLIVDHSGVIRFANPAAETLFGKSREELLNSRFGFPLANAETTEIDIVRRDGVSAIAQMRIVSMDWQGEKAHLASLRDVTELTRARKKVSLLANLVENACHDMMFVVQINGRILECNALARQTFALEAFPTADRDMQSLLYAGTGESWAEIASAVNKRSHWRGNVLAACKQGKIFPVDLTASRHVNRTDGSVNILCFLRDITREKEVDRMKSEFITVASHEMRTPLTAVRNAVDLLLQNKAGDITEKQHRFLSMALRNVDRISGLVNNLLDISRIESGRLDLDYSQVHVAQLIQDTVASLWPLATAKSISLKTQVAPNLPVIQADAVRLEQVLVNVIGNALKFTPEQGMVTIHAFTDGRGEPSTPLTLSVTDTGTGIPHEFIDHIFDKFFQVESSLSGQNNLGIGLGMAISKAIVEAHGGTIQCFSGPKQGTTFTVCLPIAPMRMIPPAGSQNHPIHSDRAE
jgi:PAS domain S-box-containing protein